MSFTNTPLFGGAITVDLPSNFADTRSAQSTPVTTTLHTNCSNSTIREIPDHQEVYLDRDGYSSIVLEILEYVSKPSDTEALAYHFDDLVDGTGDSTTILSQSSVTFADAELRYVFARDTHSLTKKGIITLHDIERYNANWLF
jgi:hypothetical protein